MKFYWFYFADGYRCAVRGLSKAEMSALVREHGKCIAKEIAY